MTRHWTVEQLEYAFSYLVLLWLLIASLAFALITQSSNLNVVFLGGFGEACAFLAIITLVKCERYLKTCRLEADLGCLPKFMYGFFSLLCMGLACAVGILFLLLLPHSRPGAYTVFGLFALLMFAAGVYMFQMFTATCLTPEEGAPYQVATP